MSNLDLENLLLAAETGQKAAIESFLYAFLQTDICVPERFQDKPLNNQPKYPNDFFYLLAIKSGETVILPAFTNSNLIESWCGQKLKFKNITGLELCKLAPTDWTIILNPGSDVAKEFSSWEIGLLKSGNAAIPEVVAEIAADFEVENLKVRPLNDGELTGLLQNLIDYAKDNQSISIISALIEEHADPAEADINEALLLGVECKDGVNAEISKSIQDELDRITRQHLIGSMQLKIFIYTPSQNDMAMRLFAHFEPIYSIL